MPTNAFTWPPNTPYYSTGRCSWHDKRKAWWSFWCWFRSITCWFHCCYEQRCWCHVSWDKNWICPVLIVNHRCGRTRSQSNAQTQQQLVKLHFLPILVSWTCFCLRITMNLHSFNILWGFLTWRSAFGAQNIKKKMFHRTHEFVRNHSCRIHKVSSHS